MVTVFKIGIVFFTTLAISVHADEPSARLVKALDKVESCLAKAVGHKEGFSDLPVNTQALALMGSGLRLAAFDLQGLARLYESYPKKSVAKYDKHLLEDSINLEDALGDAEKYHTIHNTAEFNKAAKKLVDLIYARKWLSKTGERSPRVEKIRAAVADLNWLGTNKDRTFLLEQIEGELKSIDETMFDVTHLETGFHKLRRKLRWVLMYSRVLNGMIQTANTGDFKCEQDELYFQDFVEDKYAKLPPAEKGENVCYVTKCLFDEVVGAVEAIGDVKDKAEAIIDKDEDLKKHDRLPAELIPIAKQYYKQIEDSKIVPRLRKDFKACH